jgi:hypothetical protein
MRYPAASELKLELELPRALPWSALPELAPAQAQQATQCSLPELCLLESDSPSFRARASAIAACRPVEAPNVPRQAAVQSARPLTSAHLPRPSSRAPLAPDPLTRLERF